MRIAHAVLLVALLATSLDAWACKCSGDETFIVLAEKKSVVEVVVVAVGAFSVADGGLGVPRVVELRVEKQVAGGPAPKQLLVAYFTGCADRLDSFVPGTRWVLALEAPYKKAQERWTESFGKPVPNVLDQCGAPPLAVEGEDVVIRPNFMSKEIDRGRVRMPLKELRKLLRPKN